MVDNDIVICSWCRHLGLTSRVYVMDIDNKWEYKGRQGYYIEKGIWIEEPFDTKLKVVALYRCSHGHIFGDTTKI